MARMMTVRMLNPGLFDKLSALSEEALINYIGKLQGKSDGVELAIANEIRWDQMREQDLKSKNKYNQVLIEENKP